MVPVFFIFTLARSLRATVDPTLTFRQHISKICTTECFRIQTNQFNTSISVYATKAFVYSIFLPKLYYCNSLLPGYHSIFSGNFRKSKQRSPGSIQVTTVDRVSPFLITLHWLSVHQGINYRVYSIFFVLFCSFFYHWYRS